MMDGAAHHAEQLMLEQDIEEALTHAAQVLSKDELALLSLACGVKPKQQEKSNAEH